MFELNFTYLKVPLGAEKKERLYPIALYFTHSHVLMFPFPKEGPISYQGEDFHIAPSVPGLPGQVNKQSQTTFMDTGDSQRMHETADDMS